MNLPFEATDDIADVAQEMLEPFPVDEPHLRAVLNALEGVRSTS
jgi:hypothetical protein